MRRPLLSLHRPAAIYYGWVVVAVSLLTNVAGAALNPVIFSLFITTIADDTGWSRSAIAWAVTFRLIAAGLASPLIGAAVDRFGTRWPSVAAGALAGACLAGLAVAPGLWLFYLLFALAGASGLGGPGGAVLTQVPPAKWFVAKRGRALAIASLGLSGGTVIAIPLVAWLIDVVGWRGAWAVCGIGIAALVIPANLLFMRRAPEDMGLLPDGASTAATAAGPRSAATEASWTLRQALRTRALWLALAGLTVMGMGITGTLVHRVDYWEDTGLAAGVVAAGIMLDPASVMVSSLVWGMLADRVPTRALGLLSGAVFALAMVPIALTHGETFTLFVYALTWGTAVGIYITFNNVVWPNYFGRAFLGAIRGVVLPASIVGNGLGPPLYGLLLDGGFPARALWLVTLALFVLAGLLMLAARHPGAPPQVAAAGTGTARAVARAETGGRRWT